MKVAVIGAGSMGGAIIRGLLRSKYCKAEDICCTAKTSKTLQALYKYNPELNLTQNNTEAIQEADIVIMAVKPWLMADIISKIRQEFKPDRQILVSVATGISINNIEEYLHLPMLPPIFVAIPNIAVEVLQGITLIEGRHATSNQYTKVFDLFQALGSAYLVDEEQMAYTMLVTSCGTAYALRYIRAMMEGAISLGVKPSEAIELVAKTVKGAAELILSTGAHPETEIDKVTTPGGITIKGLNAMESEGFTASVLAAFTGYQNE